jgi:hypothetical protein
MESATAFGSLPVSYVCSGVASDSNATRYLSKHEWSMGKWDIYLNQMTIMILSIFAPLCK